MSLLTVPNHWGWTWDNFSTADTPAGTSGVIVTAHASANTKGSWANISTSNRDGGGSVTTLANACYRMEIILQKTQSTGTAIGAVVDLGYSSDGGTNVTLFASNIMCGQVYGNINTGAFIEFVLPVYIPSGVSVHARIASTSGSLQASVGARYYGEPSRPEAFYECGTVCESVGIANDGSAPTNSEGTAITPGDSGSWDTTIGTSAGNWHSIGTTTNRLRYVNLMHQIRNASMSARFYYLDLGFGDGSNVQKVVARYHCATNTDESYKQVSARHAACDIPAGATLYARSVCSGTTDTGHTVAAIGVV